MQPTSNAVRVHCLPSSRRLPLLFGAIAVALAVALAPAAQAQDTTVNDPSQHQQAPQRIYLQTSLAPRTTDLAPSPVLAPEATPALGLGGGQLANKGRTFPLAIRLGAMVSPRFKFDGGVDLTLPSLGVAQHWVGRVDLDAIVSANFGGVTTIVPLTFDEIYYFPDKLGGVRIYAGGGLGVYFGDVTRFGGKLLVGANFTQNLSGELGLHFSGSGTPLLTLQVRIPL